MAGGVPVPPGGGRGKRRVSEGSQYVTRGRGDVPVLPDPGEELFSSLLDEEEKPPADVFSDLSTVLLSMDLRGGGGGGGRPTKAEGEEKKRVSGRFLTEDLKHGKKVREMKTTTDKSIKCPCVRL